MVLAETAPLCLSGLLLRRPACNSPYTTRYTALQEERREPRGFMFWNVADEGNLVERTDPPRRLWLARGLAKFLFPSPEPPAQLNA